MTAHYHCNDMIGRFDMISNFDDFDDSMISISIYDLPSVL